MLLKDDPIDTLEYHTLIKEKKYDFKVLPTFRPDKALKLNNPDYLICISKLSEVTGISINSYFSSHGCLLSDHSLESLTLTIQDEVEVVSIFKKVLNGENVSFEETERFKNHTLVLLSTEYSKNKWVMQFQSQSM